MMDTSELAVRVLGRLRESLAATDTVIDGDVYDTPGGRYVCFYDDNPLAVGTRFAGDPDKNWWTFRVMCVARTTEGLRALVTRTQSAMVWWRPDTAPSSGPVRQIAAGPQLWDGSEGDRRVSTTLTFRTVTSRPV